MFTVSHQTQPCLQTTRQQQRKQCIVVGCPELIAPSMWKAHMTLHAQGVLPGIVLITWLEENDLHICRGCVQLVSNSRLSAHSKKCVEGADAVRGSEDTPMLVDNPPVEAPPLHQPEPSLPTFEEVCLLNQPTLRFIPSRSRPTFARALSSALKSVIHENSEDAWLKLFMLPKCVLPSHRCQGRHDKAPPVDTLCNMWTDNDVRSLWNLAKGRAISHIHQSTSSIHQCTNNIDRAISLGRSGMFGKACLFLQSSGIAPNNENTWQLLKAKHLSCPVPVVPAVLDTEVIVLQPDFNILSVPAYESNTCLMWLASLFPLPYAHPLG